MAGWTPTRPERSVPGWRDGAPERPLAAEPEHPRILASRSAVTARRASFFARLSPTRRVITAFVALVALVGIVTGLGTAVTPAYGGLPPWRTSGVADLRESPTPAGWSTNLTREIAPGVPTKCASFSASSSSGTLVLLTGSAPSLDSTAGCADSNVRQVDSTVALLDTATGRVVWTRDLSKDFPPRVSPITVEGSSVMVDAQRALVQFQVDGTFTFASISLATGEVLSRASLPGNQIGLPPKVSGTLVLYAGSTSREGSTTWTLADVRRIGQPLWSALQNDATPPALTDHAAFAEADGRSVRIDGSTGAIRTFGDGRVDIASAQPDADRIYTTQRVPSGTVVTAWNDIGNSLWQRGGVGEVTSTTRGCVMVALAGASKSSCLDRDTGHTRWTTEISTGTFTFGVQGQTTNDVVAFTSTSVQTVITMLDGSTGRVEYTITVPPATFIAAASRTVAYLQTSSASGTSTGITAFDISTGRKLWSRASSNPGATQLWAGRLVSVSRAGIARELTNAPGVVLGG